LKQELDVILKWAQFIQIPAYNQVRFKAGKKMKDAVN
jgi:nucleoid DNA-binding protein